jgi:hypothetical protein
VVTKTDRVARRRAEIEARKRAERTKQQRRLAAIVGGGVATAAVVAIIVVSGLGGGAKAVPGPANHSATQIVPAGPTGQTTTKQASARRVADGSGIPGVLAWDTEGWPGDGAAHAGALEHDHVTGPVDYTITPPVGGPHDAIWMNAGVYTKPVPTERAVHDLEHGAVWITYDPTLPTADVQALTAFVTKQTMIPEKGQTAGQSNRYVDLSPWGTTGLPSKIVISSWGHQLRVDSATDPRLQQFVDTFRNSPKYSPEYGSPVDGVPVLTGGRPALDGSAVANPSGTAQE